jgi:hypothetical protein
VQRPHEAVANKEEPMTGSLTTVIRRTGLLLIVVLGALAVVGSAQGDTAQSVPAQSAIDAASANWAAKAKLLDANGRLQFEQLPPLSSIDAASANWAAKAKLLDANGLPVSGMTVSPASGSTGFNWGDFGIGAAAMFGLVLLALGLLAGTHYRRKGSVRPRPVS